LFDRFDPAAKRVLRGAEQACRNHNHYYVGVGHLLLALLEEHDAVVDERLRSTGTPPSDVIADLRRALGTGDDRSWDGILITPRVARVVRAAEEAAGPAEEVRPSHLLDAILREGGLVTELLARYHGNSATPARVRL